MSSLRPSVSLKVKISVLSILPESLISSDGHDLLAVLLAVFRRVLVVVLGGEVELREQREQDLHAPDRVQRRVH